MLDVNTSQQLAFGEAGKEQIQMIGPAVFTVTGRCLHICQEVEFLIMFLLQVFLLIHLPCFSQICFRTHFLFACFFFVIIVVLKKVLHSLG